MTGRQEVLYSFMLAASVLTSFSTEAASRKSIVIGIDDFCPYTCLEPEKPGFLVESIDVILSRSGFKLNVLHGSWTRIQLLAQEGKVDLIGPLTQYYAEANKIPSTQSLGGFFEAGFFTQADNAWVFKGYASLDKLQIAAVKGYSYPAELENRLVQAKREQRYIELVGDNANRRLVQMLASKRVDTIPMLLDVFYYQLMLLGLPTEKFRVASRLPLESNKTTYRIGVIVKDETMRTALISMLDQGFASLKADGTFQKILLKYGLGERQESQRKSPP